MGRQCRKLDQDFQQGAVRLVFETGKPIAQVARELGINGGTQGNWCTRERRRREGDTARSRRLGRSERGSAGVPVDARLSRHMIEPAGTVALPPTCQRLGGRSGGCEWADVSAPSVAR